MADETKQSDLPIVPPSAAFTIVKKKSHGGLVPGESLHGGSRLNYLPATPTPESEIHSATLKEIAGLSGSAFLKWKRTGDNATRLARALAFKKEQH
jgi:hypothetical protein